MNRAAAPTTNASGWHSLLAATFAIGVSNSVVFALLSGLQDRYHFTDAGLGWIAGSGFVVGFLAQLVIAPYADRGHSKLLLLAGLGLAVLGGGMFAVSRSLALFVLARGVLGLSNGVFLPAARAIAAGMSPDGVAERLGRLGGIELAGFVTGPVIGGALVDPLGVHWPFAVCACAALAAALALAPRHLPEPHRSEHEERLAFGLLRIPRMRVGLFLAIGLFFPVGVYDSLWARYLTDRGASNLLIGLSFLMYGIPFTLLSVRGGRLADRLGPVRACLIGLVLAAPLTATYGVIALPLVIVAVSMVEGAVQALAVPASQAIIAGAAPLGRAGAAQGLAGSAQLLTAAATSLVAPSLYGALGSGPVFALAGGAVLCCGAAAALQHRAITRRAGAPALAETPAA